MRRRISAGRDRSDEAAIAGPGATVRSHSGETLLGISSGMKGRANGLRRDGCVFGDGGAARLCSRDG